MKITLKVNGRSCRLEVDPDTPLLYVLRNDLELTGAKFGCGLEQCGACKVIVDSEAVPSCTLAVGSVQDREVTTLEGLGTSENLHPLQQAFVEERAAQCGYCIGGIIVAAKALVDRNSNPTEAEIRAELTVHVCRCGTHGRILRAVKRAAKRFKNSSLFPLPRIYSAT